jgi:hypothetical protein
LKYLLGCRFTDNSSSTMWKPSNFHHYSFSNCPTQPNLHQVHTPEIERKSSPKSKSIFWITQAVFPPQFTCKSFPAPPYIPRNQIPPSNIEIKRPKPFSKFANSNHQLSFLFHVYDFPQDSTSEERHCIVDCTSAWW